jgi:tetratricopeptide (TPR) repeat protein
LRNYDLERPHWEASERLFEQLLAGRPDDPDRMRNVALVNKYVGGRLQVRNQEAEAERRYRRALELDDRRLQAKPDDRVAQFDVAIDLANLGSSLAKAGRRAEALQYYERSVAMRSKMAEADPNDVLARTTLARVLSTTAKIRVLEGDLDGAERDAGRALAAVETVARATKDTGPRENAARALLVLAAVDAARGRSASACTRYGQVRQFVTREQFTSEGSDERVWMQNLEARLTQCPHVLTATAGRAR